MTVRRTLTTAWLAFALPAVLVLWAGPPALAQATVQRDVQYGVAGGVSLAMDVYVPSGPGPFPGLLVVHPGGFVGGDKATPDVVAVAEDFERAGYVAFAANYRLAPDFPYPAPVQDLQAAIRYIRGHHDEFNVDPNRIGAFGASAGATLAVSLGIQSKGSFCSGARVSAVVSWSAALDFEKVVAERPNAVGAIEKYSGVLGTGKQPLVPQSQVPVLLRKAEPISYLDRGDPPMFIANSVREFMPLDQAQEFAAKLQQLGIPNQFFQNPRGHALAYTANAIGPSIEFLNTYLKAAKCRAPGGSPTPTASPSVSPTRSPRHGGGGRKHPNGSGMPVLPIALGGAAVVIAAGGFGMYRLLQRRRPGYRR